MKTHRGSTFVLLTLAAVSMFPVHRAGAQAPSWLWAVSAGGANWDHAYSLATDAGGNALVAGYYASPSLTFGPTTLTNNGLYDVFISKLDGNGNALWAKSAGGTGNESITGIATDAGGNVVITGYFDSPSITFGSTTLTSAGGRDIFVVKYDASGTVLWAQKTGGNADEEGKAICTDLNGNVLITGYYNSSSVTFGTTTLTNAGFSDIFIAKYDAGGNPLWARKSGGSLYDYGIGIATDSGGNVFATGPFGSSSIAFGAVTLNIIASGGWDAFTVKFDSSGNVLWAKNAGGGECRGGAVDPGGNFVLTGTFYSTFTFGSDTLTSAGNYDVFVAKYDGNGNELWARGAGGATYDYGNSIATDVNGDVLVTGSFQGPTITFGTTTLVNTGIVDMYVVKYDAVGVALWAKNASCTNIEAGYGIAADAGGDIFVAGGYYNAPMTLGTVTLTNAGNYDVFIAKLATPVGIHEPAPDDSFAVFPNPSAGSFFISFKQAIVYGKVELMNALGMRILEENISGEANMEVNLPDLPNGLYFLRVVDGEREYAKKIMIRRD